MFHGFSPFRNICISFAAEYGRQFSFAKQVLCLLVVNRATKIRILHSNQA
jgi:hypothetical protein